VAHDKPETAKARVERWRANKRAVTLASIGGQVAGKLAQCVKCNECARLTREAGTAVVCPACQKVRDDGLALFGLTENRAGTTHAGKIVSGGNSPTHVDEMLATHERNEHGRSATYQWDRDSDNSGTDWRPKKVGRYTAGEKVRDRLQRGVEVVTDKTAVQRSAETPYMRKLRQTYYDRLARSMEYVWYKVKHPRASRQQIIAALIETEFGKTLWQMVIHGERV
jgi:hypothetical protein